MRWAYMVPVLAMISVVVADTWLDLDYELFANIAVATVAVLTTIFAGLYAVRSKWWRNRIGKTYLIKSVFLALMLIQIAVALWWRTDFPGRQHIRFVIYASAAIAYVPMIVTLWREQRRDRRVLEKLLAAADGD